MVEDLKSLKRRRNEKPAPEVKRRDAKQRFEVYGCHGCLTPHLGQILAAGELVLPGVFSHGRGEPLKGR
jgi:hypothetical protein